MMLKQKSNPWARLKYLYVLPLTAVAVVAFARPEISRKLEKISSAKISEIVPVKEVIEPKKTESVVSPVKESPVAQVPQTVKTVEKKVEPVLEKTEGSGKIPVEDITKEVQERTQKIKDKVDSSRYLILVDNEVSTYDQLDAISPDDISSFGITPKEKSEELLNWYKATDKKGVISVVTKQGIASGKVKENTVHVVGYGSLDKLSGDIKVHLRNDGTGNVKPLVFIDGIEQTDSDVLEKLDPIRIESITVLKDKSAQKIYGDKGGNGVILITTKNQPKKKTMK